LSIEVNRRRVVQTLTFWLRPRFVLRAVNRFQRIAGFDRAIALGSSALTAVIPLAVVASAISSALGGRDTADRIIDRYELTGGGAEAVQAMFAPAPGSSTSIGLLGFFFLLLAVLSFTRTVQRLFEQTWELKPLSVRNSLNGLMWIGGLTLFTVLSGFIRAAFGDSTLELAAALVTMPLTAVFLIWSGWVLSAKRISRRDLVPFGVIAAVATAIYSVGANVYVPRLFSTYATRYGVIGAVFALISALFCIMVVITASAAAGREVERELDRIRRGERPPDDEVRRQWDEITAEARARWQVLRARRNG
jgi:membrane protein